MTTGLTEENSKDSFHNTHQRQAARPLPLLLFLMESFALSEKGCNFAVQRVNEIVIIR